jgi:hypothetical protein
MHVRKSSLPRLLSTKSPVLHDYEFYVYIFYARKSTLVSFSHDPRRVITVLIRQY